MQEGTSSLMQMAKISVAVEAAHRAKIPFIAVLNDPTYGGVSASYAMQADVKIALSDARIGFAGPQVILNTMCGADQQAFDKQCPADFQSAQYLLEHGQVDMILDVIASSPKDTQALVERKVCTVARVLLAGYSTNVVPDVTAAAQTALASEVQATPADMAHPSDYTMSRRIDRPQSQDLIENLLTDYTQLSGDGRVGRDACIRGGVGYFDGRPCVVIGTCKGHSPRTMEEANYGMGSPHGYRTALRLMQMAERFGMFVLTLVDTVGAWPTFQCEGDGQSEAIATNLTVMAGLRVPIVTVLVGEGGSGGALGIGMGNRIGMLSGGYFGVISPEGAASILGRYKDEKQKAEQYPRDCQALATAQYIYANQLKDIGIVDEVIWERFGQGQGDAFSENYKHFPVLRSRVRAFVHRALLELHGKSEADIIHQRYLKYRQIGTFSEMDAAQRAAVIADAKASTSRPVREAKKSTSASLLVKHIAKQVVCSDSSRHRGLAPASCGLVPPAAPPVAPYVPAFGNVHITAKMVLDTYGPDMLASWVKLHKRVLLSDTTMRDAHQSLVATRVRTADLVEGAKVANELLRNAFSFECWGGATFDVCMRFLDECPWERLRALRAAAPNVCLQMLIRGANAVGYTSYPDNVVEEFVRLSAINGMDVFRIFDCFNIVDNMKVAINAVRKNNKVAEVSLCYTGNLLTSKIYTPEYYRSVAAEAVAAGAHIIGIKDMSGLLLPRECEPLLTAIRSVTSLPIHFHTHSTSSVSLTTCMEMARLGCDIIDFCTASMADGTSQPSMNAFCAMMENLPNAPAVNYLSLEPYDMYWARVRDMYSPFESGMKSGTARVFDHQIPGGQYSNLLVQCQSMGLWGNGQWEEVCDAYRDVNELFGDIIKVTPSSKCVGDLALYLVTRRLKASQLLSDPALASSIDWPESVVGLLRGDLGFPHRGFPAAVEAAILKGTPKRTIRAGLQLPKADFDANCQKLSITWNQAITPEMGMSSIMYPGVFKDFMQRRAALGLTLRYLPTPVYFYAMQVGQSFTMQVPQTLVGEVLRQAATDKFDVVTSKGDEIGAPTTRVTITLRGVGPLKDSMRTVSFAVSGADGIEQEQSVDIKDSTGKFVFAGPMAVLDDKRQVASPMPGTVLEIQVKVGQKVKAGTILMIISAMKMEVKSTAPHDGVVKELAVEVGARVVEGCLLCTVDPA